MAHTAKSDGRFGRSQKSEHILRSCPWASDGKCDSLDLNRLASRRSAQLEVACGYQSMDWMVLSLKELELLGTGRVVQRDDTSLLLESHDSIRFQNWIIILLYNCICRGTESIVGAWIACWLERRTRDRKVASSNPGRSGGRIFYFRVNFVCWLLFGVRSIPVLPQWHVKDPGHSAKSAGGRLHLNTHKPLTRRSQSGLTMPLSRHDVGTYQEKSSHATRQGTPGHSRLSSLSLCGPILA